MAAQSRTTLKTYFNTGDTPTEAQFANLIDSAQNITDDGTALTDITGESIGDLSDVGDATATDGNVLVADGDSWESRALTEADISDFGTYLTDITGESIGDLSDVTITTGAQGDILYNDGSGYVNLAPGTNGHFLKTQGAAANPTWDAIPGGGDMLTSTYDPQAIAGDAFDRANHTGVIDGTITELAEIGTATFDDLQDYINNTMSSGYVTGGTITDNGDGTVATASMTGYIRADGLPTSELKSFDVGADASVTLTDEALNYVYCDYNSGTPAILATNDLSILDHTSKFIIGLVYREGTGVHIVQTGQNINNHVHKDLMHSFEHDGIERATGLVTSHTGTNNLAITAGVLYWSKTRLTTDAVDTSAADSFTYVYRDGSNGWTEVDTQTAIDNTQYDDGDGGLATLTAGRYGVHWVFTMPDGDIYVMYGRGDYTLAQAQAATLPSDRPGELLAMGVFIAKILIVKSAASFYSVSVPWDSSIGLSAASDHGALAGLADDDHPQYIKDSEFTQDSGVLVGTGAGTFAEETGSTLLTSIGAAAASHTHVEADITDLGTYLTDITGESIGDLSDVGDATATSGNVLVADGDSWESRALTEADISDLGTYMENPMTTAGDIIIGGASGASTRLGIGTATQVLTVNAGATAPEWADAAAGGSGGPRGFTYVVASADSRDNTGADAVCDNTADQVEIQAAIDAVAAAGGGSVLLLDGTFTLSASIEPKSYVHIYGAGQRSTILTQGGTDEVFYASATVAYASIRGVRIGAATGYRGIHFDGSGCNNIYLYDLYVFSVGTYPGIQYDGTAALIDKCTVSGTPGIFAGGANTVSVTNCTILAGSTVGSELGIYVNGDYSVVSGNYVAVSQNRGIQIGGHSSATNNSVVGGASSSNLLSAAGFSRVTGNELRGFNTAGVAAIAVEGFCTVTGNTIYGNTSTTGNVGVYINGNCTTVSSNFMYAVYYAVQCGGLTASISNNTYYNVDNEYTSYPGGGTISFSASGNTFFSNALESVVAEDIKLEARKNISGGSLNYGDVVVENWVAGGNEATTTTTGGDINVLGVYAHTCADDDTEAVQTLGIFEDVNVDGSGTAIAIGDPLTCSSSAGKAVKATTGDWVFARALEASTTDNNIRARLVTKYQQP